MSWWRRVLRAIRPFGYPREKPTGEAQEALLRADRSRAQAFVDHDRARRLREETDRVAEKLAEHNAANRYADWIMRVVKERD